MVLFFASLGRVVLFLCEMSERVLLTDIVSSSLSWLDKWGFWGVFFMVPVLGELVADEADVLGILDRWLDP